MLYLYFNNFASIYLNNVLVFSDTLEEYKTYIIKMLKALQKTGLQVNINKSEFYIKKVKYLNFIIIINSIKMDPAKVEIILK